MIISQSKKKRKKENAKKVSVVIPNYNYKKYLKKRVDSILRQTYPIYELIFLDDASIDGSQTRIEEIIQEIKKRKPELKVKRIFNKQNSGRVIRQWKKGFEEAEGDFIWIAEVDDLSRKNFLAEVMKGFENPEVVLSYSESMVINAWGLMIVPDFRWSRDREKTGHYDKDYVKDGKKEIEEIMAIRCTIPNVSAVVFRRNQKFLKYLEQALKYRQVGDWYFYIRVLEQGKISYSHKSLNCFRVHDNSATKNSRKGGEHYREVLLMHKMFQEKFKLSEDVLDRMNKEAKRIQEKHEATS